MLYQRLNLGCECEHPAIPEVVERLDAHPIPRAKQPLTLRVPNRKRKHPAEVTDAFGPILFVRMEDGLSIRSRLITMPCGFKSGPESGVIIDLAVVSDPQRAILVAHRLPAALDIHHRQPPVAQVRVRIVVETKVVRPAMPDRLRHPPQDPDAAIGRLYGDKSGNPAHTLECKMARRALRSDKLNAEEWVSG